MTTLLLLLTLSLPPDEPTTYLCDDEPQLCTVTGVFLWP